MSQAELFFRPLPMSLSMAEFWNRPRINDFE